VDDSDSRLQEGSGIGLALVKELVELHHGSISVQSEPEKGTTFIICLPVGKEHLKPEEIADDSVFRDQVQSSASQAEPETWKTEHGTWNMKHETIVPSSTPGTSNNPVILLVEDNPDMRHYINSFLKSSYQLTEVDNGKDGLDAAISQIPDLIVSDVMMPGMDGYELCRKLRTDERTSHIPIILLTAKASLEDKLEGLGTGADDFINKPFEPAELMIRVRNLLHQRQLLREKFRRELEHVTLVPEHSMSAMEVKFMERARKVVGDNLSNPDFDIEEFSRQMHMSRVQLHRKLVGLFNLSASAFIRASRLNAAARLLEAKTGNVAQVAYEVGFNNLSYFSKCFREQFGCLPSEYPQL
jgi:DNA-binding response OmpR family regulator